MNIELIIAIYLAGPWPTLLTFDLLAVERDLRPHDPCPRGRVADLWPPPAQVTGRVLDGRARQGQGHAHHALARRWGVD